MNYEIVVISCNHIKYYLGSCPIRGALSLFDRTTGDISSFNSSFVQACGAPSAKKQIHTFNDMKSLYIE